MNIVLKTANPDDNVKITFAKLILGSAAGFIATALVETAVGKFAAKKNTATTKTTES